MLPLSSKWNVCVCCVDCLPELDYIVYADIYLSLSYVRSVEIDLALMWNPELSITLCRFCGNQQITRPQKTSVYIMCMPFIYQHYPVEMVTSLNVSVALRFYWYVDMNKYLKLRKRLISGNYQSRRFLLSILN